MGVQGEPAHVAMRRVHLALVRHQEAVSKPDSKRDIREGIKGYCVLPMSTWHASQASLWSVMGGYRTAFGADMTGCSDLAMVHEDLALESAADDEDTRMTVLLLRADRVSAGAARRICVIYVLQLVAEGKIDDALASLTAHDNIGKISISCYHRWGRAVWSILHRKGCLR